MLTRAGLYFRTARHMPLTQLFYFVLRRFMPQGGLAQEAGAARLRAESILPAAFSIAPPLPAVKACVRDGRFEFLAQTSTFGIDAIDWRASQYPKLWRYNLHYFDWLKNSKPDDQWAGYSISSWIAHNPAGSADAWEPYTASLRLVNWIKFFLSRQQAGLNVPEEWLFSLMQQGEWLNRNIEYHIRANHLLKNLVAMVWLCSYLQSNHRFSVWRDRYCDLLERELVEQFNPDGGHYERSPMYHAICLEDCLDLYNLLQHAQVGHGCTERLVTVIQRGLVFLQDVSFADGKIALFGDSALHGAHDIEVLSAYWHRLNAQAANQRPVSGARFAHYPDSRFVVRSTASYKIVISTGGISPDYQPGHTHCDMGSFEIHTPQGRIFVDSGVSQYAPGPMRKYVRSSLAHNVVRVNGDEQHELWGEFRVGARGAISEVSVVNDADVSEIRLRIQSHSAVRVAWCHTRTITLHPAAISIVDLIDVPEISAIVSSLHLHPDISVVEESSAVAESRELVLNQKGMAVARMSVSGAEKVSLEPSVYCPDFGVEIKNHRICLQQQGAGMVEMKVNIAFCSRHVVPPEAVEIPT